MNGSQACVFTVKMKRNRLIFDIKANDCKASGKLTVSMNGLGLAVEYSVLQALECVRYVLVQ